MSRRCFISLQLSILQFTIYFIEPLHRLSRHLGLLLLGIDRSVEKHLPVWIDDLESGLSVRVVVAQFAPLAIIDHITGGTIYGRGARTGGGGGTFLAHGLQGLESMQPWPQQHAFSFYCFVARKTICFPQPFLL